MFCPKCGTQNPETGKFCRACGTDLGNVSAVISGNLPANLTDAGVAHIHHEARRRRDPNEVFGDSVKNIILGIGFLVVSIVLLVTNVANGKNWWWAMLFPAFGLLASGISCYLKYQRMEKSQAAASLNQNQTNQTQNLFNQPPPNSALPPTQADYVRPPQKSVYDTGELYEKPPSVTEGTTRHLEINNEGETMTLPKK
jgi:hypothetical protein